MGIADQSELYTRWGQLKTERASWIPLYQDLTRFLLPYAGRYFAQDRDKGMRRDRNIYDSEGTRSLRVLAAGMMSGMTSPARPWFRITTTDPKLAKSQAVKVWLSQVTLIMRAVLAKSNAYRALHSLYQELGVFGTAPSLILPDDTSVIRHYPITTGEYCIATNFKGEVDTLYREFEKPVGQIVKEFGLTNCSTAVKNLYDRGALDAWITIVHAIEPRADRDPSKLDAKNKRFRSCYFELGADKDQYLRDSGFDMFPGVAPRWEVSGNDIYGNSPGMHCIGDIKALQHEQLRKAEGIDYQTKPPLQMPTSLKGREVDSLPGGVTYVDVTAGNQGIQTQFEVRLDLNALLMDIQDVRSRIRSTFYADLFLMLANQTDARMTATEVAERHEEKLLMLGPVLERLQDELLRPMLETTFMRMLQTGKVPPPPQELAGQNLDIEYTSILAQAQAAVGTNSVDRYVVSMGQLAQFKPDVLDKFNSDAWADAYSDMLGIDPELIVPDQQVALIRAQRAKAAQKQQQMEQAAQASATAKNVSQVNPQQLQDVMSQFSGYSTPQAGGVTSGS